MTKCNMFNVVVKDQLAELFRRRRSINKSSNPSRSWLLHSDSARLGSVTGTHGRRAGKSPLSVWQTKDSTVGSLKGPAQLTTIMGAARQTPVALYQSPCQKPTTTPPLKVYMDNTAVAVQEGQPYKNPSQCACALCRPLSTTAGPTVPS